MRNLPGIKKWVDLDQGFSPTVSASKLSQFRNDLAMFVCRYGYNKKSKASPAMWRGIMCEDAVVEVLTNQKKIDQAIDDCQGRYKSTLMITGMFSDTVQKEYNSLEPIIRNACDALSTYGVPEFAEDGGQQMIEFDIEEDDWSITGIGYLDLVFPNGQIIDLKTSHVAPTEMSPDHMMQRAFYKTAKDNYDVKFLYVTPKKTALLEDGDVVDVMKDVKVLIKQLDNFCNNLTPDQARKCIPIAESKFNFYWKGEDELKNFYRKD